MICAALLAKIHEPFDSTGRLISLLLGNLEHLINHKQQLFTYLKLLGADVTSQDLYPFRQCVRRPAQPDGTRG